jgi:polyisoprenoid-binding protein YceI
MRKSLTFAALLVVPALAAASLAPLSLQPGSRVWVDGTSTVRSWHCESNRAEGTAATATVDVDKLGAVSSAELTVPVATLDCRNTTMNGHMRHALNADANPQIRFHATSVQVTAAGAEQGSARLAGDLTISGQSKPVTINATLARENGQLRVRGSKQINMTEWGVHPPSLMLGTMKVAPAVTVGFDVVLKP